MLLAVSVGEMCLRCPEQAKKHVPSSVSFEGTKLVIVSAPSSHLILRRTFVYSRWCVTAVGCIYGRA